MNSDPTTDQPPSHPDPAISDSVSPASVDWEELRSQAQEMTARAYAPYSGFAVGAAALTTSGQIVRGCNVENASYGLTLCAECGLVSEAVQHNAGEIIALAVVSRSGEYCSPCGRCRQLLVEHSTPEAMIDTPEGPRLITELLPGHFSSSRLGGD